MRDFRTGIGHGDPKLGGQRKGKAGYTDEDDSPQFMSAYGWLTELWSDTGIIPNSRERHLDYIPQRMLHDEYYANVRELGQAKSIASFKVRDGVWEGHFSELKIREHKAVDGKNKKRAELLRLLRARARPNAWLSALSRQKMA